MQPALPGKHVAFATVVDVTGDEALAWTDFVSLADDGPGEWGRSYKVATVARYYDRLTRFGDRYVRRVFTAHEIESCCRGSHIVSEGLAARFAAKEATIKVLQPKVDASLYILRARAYIERKDRRSARADFETVVALGPGRGLEDHYVGTLVQLGYEKHRAGEYQAALADFETALCERPDYHEAHRQRADTLLKLGRYVEAGESLDRYWQKGQPSFEVYLARGMIHARMGQHSAAIDWYNLALQRKHDPRVLTQRGWAYLYMDSPKLALADFEAALANGKDTFDARCGRGTAHARLGHVTEAVEDAEAAIEHATEAESLLPLVLNRNGQCNIRALRISDLGRHRSDESSTSGHWKLGQHLEHPAGCRGAEILLKRRGGVNINCTLRQHFAGQIVKREGKL